MDFRDKNKPLENPNVITSLGGIMTRAANPLFAAFVLTLFVMQEVITCMGQICARQMSCGTALEIKASMIQTSCNGISSVDFPRP